MLFRLLNHLLACFRPKTIVMWAAYLFIPAAIWIYYNYATLQAYFNERDRYNTYRTEVANLEKQQARLSDDLKSLKSGGFSLEKTIRERHGMIKPGEKVIILNPPLDGTATATEHVRTPSVTRDAVAVPQSTAAPAVQSPKPQTSQKKATTPLATGKKKPAETTPAHSATRSHSQR